MANLREIRVSRPEPDPGIAKRWFESDYFDLFLWYREKRIFHMQLCYGKPMGERAASWRDGHGYFHDGVSSLAGSGGATASSAPPLRPRRRPRPERCACTSPLRLHAIIPASADLSIRLRAPEPRPQQ